MAMNPEVKKQWLEALRSGEYEQGNYLLRSTDDQFCCLGVLCDIYVKQTGTSWEKRDNCSHYMLTEGEGRFDGFLPPMVCNWAGLEDINPVIEGASLTSHNDLSNKNFSEIADLIERNL